MPVEWARRTGISSSSRRRSLFRPAEATPGWHSATARRTQHHLARAGLQTGIYVLVPIRTSTLLCTGVSMCGYLHTCLLLPAGWLENCDGSLGSLLGKLQSESSLLQPPCRSTLYSYIVTVYGILTAFQKAQRQLCI